MVFRFIQTLQSKVAGLESVLSSTKQRAAADRHALDALRNERVELQVRVSQLKRRKIAKIKDHENGISFVKWDGSTFTQYLSRHVSPISPKLRVSDATTVSQCLRPGLL